MKHSILVILTLSLFMNKVTHGFRITSTVYSRTHLIHKRRVCVPSQGKCGSLCYDTKLYTCQNLYGKKPFLCHKEDAVCGDSCYDPNEKTCYGSGEDAVACHWGSRLCPANGRCYDPKTSSCPSSQSSSSSFFPNSNNNNNNNWDNNNRQSSSWKSTSSSGWEITPIQNDNKPFSFWNNNAGNSNGNNRIPIGQIEPKPNPFMSSSSCGMGNYLCGAICYDPTKQTCFGEQDGPPRLFSLVCPKGNKRCGNSCYDPIISRCSIDGDSSSMNNMNGNGNQGSHGHNYCSYGHVLCGSKCIDPMEQTCNNNEDISYSSSGGGNKWNNNNKDSSGSSSSWNSGGGNSLKSQSTWNSNGESSSSGCGSGLSKCGAICYDPFKQSCLGNNDSDRLLCESGQEACGKKCYDPFNQRCINIGSGGNSGGTGEGGIGGGLMFFSGGSGSGNTVWGKNGGASKKLICKWNESACGAKCYDPQKDRCNGNSMTSIDNDF